MTATMEEKQEIIRDMITCAGVGNIKKYHCYLERFSPEYLLDDVGKSEGFKRTEISENTADGRRRGRPPGRTVPLYKSA